MGNELNQGLANSRADVFYKYISRKGNAGRFCVNLPSFNRPVIINASAGEQRYSNPRRR
jgi:hypothetical protein